ncbi:MAG TPA: cytochrome c [Planctomycetaceae bacterium]|nr:cytochrome c [Planctomycetaceae bacterium]
MSGRQASQVRWLSAWLTGLSALAIALSVAGCGGKKPEPVADKTEAAASPSTSAPKKTSKRSSKGGTQTAAKPGRQMIGDIPLDVWFNDPIGEMQKQGTVAVVTPNATAPAVADANVPKKMQDDAPAAPAAGGGGGDDWKDLISGEDLQEEVKRIRSELKNSLQGPGQYNAHYKEIQVQGAVLAALAAVAAKHPEPPSWKGKAKFVRDAASDVAAKSKGLGQKAFEETQKPYEKVDALLSGNTPADLGESADDVPFSEVASRKGLMGRMDLAEQWLRSNVANETVLKKEAEKVAHESAVLAALSKIIASEGYDSTDEQDYQDFAKKMIEASLDINKAAKAGDMAGFNDGMSRVKKQCDGCHLGYRNG